jgi:acyl-CoA thioester hydrolase
MAAINQVNVLSRQTPTEADSFIDCTAKMWPRINEYLALPTAPKRASRLRSSVAVRPLRTPHRIRHILPMLDRLDLEPAFFAPFVSSLMRVEQGWIDYNGHLNMAYYNVLFDRAVDEAYELLGCGLEHVETSKHSCFTAEVHVRYLRELRAGDPVRVTFQLLGFDAKRLHYFEQLFHAEDGWLSATSENMALYVDMAAKKTAAFPTAVDARLARMRAAHAALPIPEAAGRRITMPEPLPERLPENSSATIPSD